MATYNADEVLELLDEDVCANEVLADGSDEEFEYESYRYDKLLF